VRRQGAFGRKGRARTGPGGASPGAEQQEEADTEHAPKQLTNEEGEKRQVGEDHIEYREAEYKQTYGA